MLQITTQIVDALALITRQAGEVIMTHYHDTLQVELKTDSSPVTIADREANDLIVAALKELTPDIPIIAEESVTGDEEPQTLEEFWLVDPLDGTKEFIHRNGDFTVNIALIQKGVPVCGVVHPPVHGTVYVGIRDRGAFREDSQGQRTEIQAREVNQSHPTVVVSRSHRSSETDRFLERFPSFEEVPKGSSLKLCALAEGEADVYPRLGRTMEWDIAAGHAVLIAAGGTIEVIEGGPLLYGKKGLENPHFVAWGRMDQ